MKSPKSQAYRLINDDDTARGDGVVTTGVFPGIGAGVHCMMTTHARMYYDIMMESGHVRAERGAAIRHYLTG